MAPTKGDSTGSGHRRLEQEVNPSEMRRRRSRKVRAEELGAEPKATRRRQRSDAARKARSGRAL